MKEEECLLSNIQKNRSAVSSEGIGYQKFSDLTAWMQENIEDFEGTAKLERFSGGQSNPTFKVISAHKNYVLRTKPAGKILKGAHAIEREFKVTKALENTGFPVPKPYGLCEDVSIIGTPFYIMDMVEGRIFWSADLSTVDEKLRPLYFDEMNETMAKLHRQDPDSIGLGDYGHRGNYFKHHIKRWSNQYLQDNEAGRFSDMDMLVEWLPDNIPLGDETSLVHGDFRIDNMIWHPEHPHILAVLDWELSTLGHPLADFAYHLLMYHLPPHIVGGIKGLDIEGLNITSQDDYVTAYCRRTGRGSIPNLNFYLVFNLFRFAAIVHGIKGRLARGNAASAEAQNLINTLPEIAGIARSMVDSSGNSERPLS